MSSDIRYQTTTENLELSKLSTVFDSSNGYPGGLFQQFSRLQHPWEEKILQNRGAYTEISGLLQIYEKVLLLQNGEDIDREREEKE